MAIEAPKSAYPPKKYCDITGYEVEGFKFRPNTKIKKLGFITTIKKCSAT